MNENHKDYNNPIFTEVYMALARADQECNDDAIPNWLNANGFANLTVCPVCRIDDFVHSSVCSIADMLEAEFGVLKRDNPKPQPAPPEVDHSARTLLDGSPVPEDNSHTAIDPHTGQQLDYVVLSAEERSKGFVRRVRKSYRHVGPPAPRYSLRDLTEEESKHHAQWNYVKFEKYPPEKEPLTGMFWTQDRLDRANKACMTVTSMGNSLAETYARDPKFYSGTFCATCQEHFPVGENGEFIWLDGERVGT